MFEWNGVWYKVKNLITAEVNDGDEHPSQTWGSIARGAVATGAASGVGGYNWWIVWCRGFRSCSSWRSRCSSLV